MPPSKSRNTAPLTLSDGEKIRSVRGYAFTSESPTEKVKGWHLKVRHSKNKDEAPSTFFMAQVKRGDVFLYESRPSDVSEGNPLASLLGEFPRVREAKLAALAYAQGGSVSPYLKASRAKESEQVRLNLEVVLHAAAEHAKHLRTLGDEDSALIAGAVEASVSDLKKSKL